MSLRHFIASSLIMEYYTLQMPEHLSEGCDKGNPQTRNARFRRAVCAYLELKWHSCSGNGNCFFEAVCMCLRSVGKAPDLTAAQLRADVVEYLRLCPGSTQDLPERICAEMFDEINEPLVCSTRGRLNSVRLNGFVPGTVAEYLDASACDSVWVRGMHWLRAVSFLHHVQVAVVINEQLMVRYIGNGDNTIHLYKVDADTHWDPLLPAAYASPSLRPLPSAHADYDSDTLLISSDSSQPTTKTIVPDLPRLRQRKPTVALQAVDSSSESDAPGTYSVSFAVYTLPHIVTQCKEELQECSAVRTLVQQSAKETVLRQVCIQTLHCLPLQCVHAVYTLHSLLRTQMGEERSELHLQVNTHYMLYSVYTAYLCSVCMQCIHYTHSYEHSWAKKGHNAAA
jgi:hypothetical protein